MHILSTIDVKFTYYTTTSILSSEGITATHDTPSLTSDISTIPLIIIGQIELLAKNIFQSVTAHISLKVYQCSCSYSNLHYARNYVIFNFSYSFFCLFLFSNINLCWRSRFQAFYLTLKWLVVLNVQSELIIHRYFNHFSSLVTY